MQLPINRSQPPYISQNVRLTSKQAAAYLGLSPQTLKVWRYTKRYPLPYYKIAGRVFYEKDDLDRFIAEGFCPR